MSLRLYLVITACVFASTMSVVFIFHDELLQQREYTVEVTTHGFGPDDELELDMHVVIHGNRGILTYQYPFADGENELTEEKEVVLVIDVQIVQDDNFEEDTMDYLVDLEYSLKENKAHSVSVHPLGNDYEWTEFIGGVINSIQDWIANLVEVV